MNTYLTKEHIEILLKLCCLGKYTKVAEISGITPSRVKAIEENALRCIRVSYSQSYKQGKPLDGKTVLHHMAERSGLRDEKLTAIFDSCIAEGCISENKPYWEQTQRKKSGNPTAIELLDFLFEKYELKIVPLPLED